MFSKSSPNTPYFKIVLLAINYSVVTQLILLSLQIVFLRHGLSLALRGNKMGRQIMRRMELTTDPHGKIDTADTHGLFKIILEFIHRALNEI